MVNLPFSHNHGPIAKAMEKEQIVINDNQGPCIVLKKFLKNPFLPGVEICCRFIKDEHIGFHGHDACKCGPLFLTVTQQMGRLVAEFFQPDDSQLLLDPFFNCSLIESLIHWAKGYIVI